MQKLPLTCCKAGHSEVIVKQHNYLRVARKALQRQQRYFIKKMLLD